MDFSVSPDQEKLQDEFRGFFKREMDNAPVDWHGGNVEEPYLSDENWALPPPNPHDHFSSLTCLYN